MNRILRPGVCLIFLMTGMSAAALSEARDNGTASNTAGLAATGTHLRFLTAAILCHAVASGSGVSSPAASHSGDVFSGRSEDTISFPRIPTLGFAKRSHFGLLSAHKV